MAIEIQKRFSVRAPAARVWSFLTDPQQVSTCLAGSKVMGRAEDGTHTGTMKVKLGPVSSTYKGTLRFERLDEEAYVAELEAAGKDVRGKGAADLTMRSELTEAAGITEVEVVATVRVTGVLAQLGRGMIEDVSDQLFEQFTDCMKEKLEDAEPTPSPAPPTQPESDTNALDLTSVGTKAATRAVGRLLKGPAFWIVIAIAAGVLWWLLR